MMFLTDDELQALTGYKRRDKQKAWLRKAGIPFLVSAKGFPVVALKEIDRRRRCGPYLHLSRKGATHAKTRDASPPVSCPQLADRREQIGSWGAWSPSVMATP